jgi:hypothetical protein
MADLPTLLGRIDDLRHGPPPVFDTIVENPLRDVKGSGNSPGFDPAPGPI